MTITFEDNEFAQAELLEYLERAYGTMVNGKPFTVYSINSWLYSPGKKIPDAYGGGKITNVQKIPGIGSRVFTVNGLSRMDIEATYGKLTQFARFMNGRRLTAKEEELVKSPVAKRVFKSGEDIPMKYKQQGIKNNQVKRWGGKRSVLNRSTKPKKKK